MKGKRTSSYRAIFAALEAHWKQLGLEPAFERVQTDFEEGLMKAVAEVSWADKALACSPQAIALCLLEVSAAPPCLELKAAERLRGSATKQDVCGPKSPTSRSHICLRELCIDVDLYGGFEKMPAQKRQAARSPFDRQRWKGDIDLLAAAVLFTVNIHCHTGGPRHWNWQSYRPEAARGAS